MKQLLGVFILLIIIAFAGLFTKNGSITMASLQKLFHTPTATIKGQTFSLLITKTESDRETGLSGRDSLPKNEAMLFQFDRPDYYAFWMKNMKFPIDIIFIKDNEVVTVYNNMQPPKNNTKTLPVVKPSEPANAVLEINAGLAQQYHIQTGDTVTFSL